MEINKSKKHNSFFGKTHSEVTKQRMKLAWEKRRLTPFSLETRNKMSMSRTGEKNPTWKGGGHKYQLELAKKRDNYTCQRCGFTDKNIVVIDHINPRFFRPDLSLLLGNLMTLCPNCHARKTKEDRKIIASHKRSINLVKKTRYQNSVCMKRGWLHKWIEITRTSMGTLERCERCGLKKHFSKDMPNHIYLSFHIRSILRANDPRFKKEYPHAN